MKKTLVCFHDLLGFGQMVAVSGGTLDSSVGKIALQRIELLRGNIGEISEDFPDGTRLFHLNDSAIAVLDINLPVGSMHVEPQTIHSSKLNVVEVARAARFLGAAAKLHQATISSEQDNMIGPAGRTFVVLGDRWEVDEREDQVEDVNELQANLAFAEAYEADSLGSKVGFSGRCWDSLYINDQLWFVLSVGFHDHPNITAEIMKRLSANKNETHWPNRLLVQKKNPIEVPIFHRKRVYRALMSHHAISLLDVPFPNEQEVDE